MSNTIVDISNEQKLFRGDKVFFVKSISIALNSRKITEALVMCSQKDDGLSNDFRSFRLLKVNSRNEVLPNGELVEWIHESKLELLDRADEEKLKIIEDYEDSLS